jgi:hypothetical protein
MIYLFRIDSQRCITVGGPAVHACRSETALGCTMREAAWESFACFTCFACCVFQYRKLFAKMTHAAVPLTQQLEVLSTATVLYSLRCSSHASGTTSGLILVHVQCQAD